MSHTGGRPLFHWKMLRMRSSVSLAEPDSRVVRGERGGEDIMGALLSEE